MLALDLAVLPDPKAAREGNKHFRKKLNKPRVPYKLQVLSPPPTDYISFKPFSGPLYSLYWTVDIDILDCC